MLPDTLEPLSNRGRQRLHGWDNSGWGALGSDLDTALLDSLEAPNLPSVPAVLMTTSITSFPVARGQSCLRMSDSGESQTLALAVLPSLRTMSPVKQTVIRQRQKGLNPAVRKLRKMNFFFQTSLSL